MCLLSGAVISVNTIKVVFYYKVRLSFMSILLATPVSYFMEVIPKIHWFGNIITIRTFRNRKIIDFHLHQIEKIFFSRQFKLL